MLAFYIVVPEEGLEPSSLAAYDFESYVYTNSTTPAYSTYYINKPQESILLAVLLMI